MTVQAIELPAQQGSQEGAIDFDALFRLYARELNGFAFRRLDDWEAAADVVQDGFLRTFVWHRAKQRTLAAAEARYLLWSVVGNLVIDLIRRRKVRGTQLPLDAANEIADPYPTQDRFIEGRQTFRLFKQALDEAPAVQRTALLMNRIGGLTHPEIAERLGVSASMVSKYIMAVMDRIIMRLSDTID